jgi:hypothetical protein
LFNTQSLLEAAMPYGVEEELAPPANLQEYNQRFYDDMIVSEFSNEAKSLLGEIAVQKRWGMVRDYVKVFKPKQGGPGGLKTLEPDYKIEALDERHRMADMLSTMKRVYDQTFPATFQHRSTLFFNWLDGLSDVLPGVVKQILKNAYGNQFPDSAYGAFVTSGVDYKNNLQRRFTNLITIRRGIMYKHWPGKKPFDTRDTQTFFSGRGWAIYVVSASGLWFAGSHLVGQLQHSSFVGGRPVMSAGEIQVHNGEPLIISAKSGHYKPTMEQFLAGLNSLKANGVNMETLKVAVFEQNASGQKQKVLLTAQSFLINSNLRSRYTVW